MNKKNIMTTKKVLLYESSIDRYDELMDEYKKFEESEKQKENEVVNSDSESEKKSEQEGSEYYDQIFITRDDTDSVVFSIIEKFIKRSELGVKKYGTDLDRKDLSVLDWIRHAQEEHMDAILYLEKLKQEMKILQTNLIKIELKNKKNSIDNIFFYIIILFIFFYNLFITYHYNHIN